MDLSTIKLLAEFLVLIGLENIIGLRGMPRVYLVTRCGVVKLLKYNGSDFRVAVKIVYFQVGVFE